MITTIKKDSQYYKFCAYGFLKNLKFFEPFLILFYLEKGLSFLEIGTLYSIGEITRNILEIPSGVMADAFGRRRTLVFSFGFYIVSFIIFYLTSSFGLFVVAVFFYGIGDAFRTGTHKSMIFEYLRIKGWETQKVHYYGHTRSWSQRGSAISSLIAAGIVFYSGTYITVFLFSTIPYLADLILIASYPSVLEGPMQDIDKKMIKDHFKKIFREFTFSIRNTTILKAITNLSAHSGYFKAVKDFLQPVIKTFATGLPVLLGLAGRQRTALLIGIIYFIIYLLSSGASRNAGRFSGLFRTPVKPLNFTLLAGLLAGVVSGIFYNLQLTAISIIFFVLIYLIENMRKPAGIAYVTDMLNQNILATVLSTESQAISLITALIAPLLGFMADKFGIGTGLIAVSVILIIFLPLFVVKEQNKGLSAGH